MKKVNYPNFNDYDLSAYEELKGDVLYMINGGVVMSEADRQAMAQAGANNDKAAQEEILKKYENTETPSSTPPASTQTTPPPTSTTPPATNTTPNTNNPTTSPTTTTEDPKQPTTSGSGSDSGSGSGGGAGSGGGGNTQGTSSTNPYAGREESLSYEEQYQMAMRDAERKNGVVPTTVEADNTYCVNNYKETVKYTGGEQIKGQGLSPTAMEDLIRGRSNPFEGRNDALTPAEQAEMARQHAVIKKNTKETKVWIVRNDDGLGNEFNATRYIYKDGKLVYQDVVGANCSEKYYDKDKSEVINYNSTTPDGRYYLTNKSQCLTIQPDGTANSGTFNNVLALMTYDLAISKRDRDAVNYGDRYFHPNQYGSDSSPYNSNMTPGSAGCIIGMYGQARQDEMMNVLMDGVYNPTSIQVNIVSLSNMEVFKK